VGNCCCCHESDKNPTKIIEICPDIKEENPIKEIEIYPDIKDEKPSIVKDELVYITTNTKNLVSLRIKRIMEQHSNRFYENTYKDVTSTLVNFLSELGLSMMVIPRTQLPTFPGGIHVMRIENSKTQINIFLDGKFIIICE
jgi:hypothetical protein